MPSGAVVLLLGSMHIAQRLIGLAEAPQNLGHVVERIAVEAELHALLAQFVAELQALLGDRSRVLVVALAHVGPRQVAPGARRACAVADLPLNCQSLLEVFERRIDLIHAIVRDRDCAQSLGLAAAVA